jgi:hypothetical protein
VQRLRRAGGGPGTGRGRPHRRAGPRTLAARLLPAPGRPGPPRALQHRPHPGRALLHDAARGRAPARSRDLQHGGLLPRGGGGLRAPASDARGARPRVAPDLGRAGPAPARVRTEGDRALGRRPAGDRHPPRGGAELPRRARLSRPEPALGCAPGADRRGSLLLRRSRPTPRTSRCSTTWCGPTGASGASGRS